VLRKVWELGEATVKQVYEALSDERQVDFWTVQTYLRRLARKGYVRARRVGHANSYEATVPKKTVIRELIDEFVGRVFDGEALPLLQHFVEQKSISKSEIDELQRYLEELKRDRK
jgi:predicted transcriptional regulator